MRSAIFAGLVAAATALSIPVARDTDASRPPSSVFYILVNKKDAASIVAINSDPNASQFVSTPTGGRGDSIQQIGRPGMDIPMDVLQSAFSVVVDQNQLFAVNAGSNQLSMFNINPSDPLHPKLVGQPASSGGDWPVSVAYSRRLNQACVLNAGAKNGVQCYNVDARRGLTPNGAFRPLSQTTQTTPPVFNNGSSAISFNQDSSLLFVSGKGAPMVVYPVQNGRIAQQGVSTPIADMTVAFGHDFVSPNTVFVADPNYGGSLLTIDPRTHKVTEGPHTDEHTPVDVLDMSCWAVYVPKVNKVYTSDADRPHFGSYNAKTGAWLGTAEYNTTLKGAFDSLLDSRDGKTIWFQTPDNVIASYDAVAQKAGPIIIVDTFYAGARHYWQGLAQWTAGGYY